MIESELTLVIGDTGYYLSDLAKSIDSKAYLVDYNNLLDYHRGTIYTSLGDIDSLEHFFILLKKAAKIVYYPPKIWSDKKTNQEKFSTAWLTEHYLQLVSSLNNIHIENFVKTPNGTEYNSTPRKTDKTQLWIAGCSTTKGVGVSEHERYWEIIKAKLNLEASVMAERRASNSWCRDQLLNCDIQSGDIVIWGLTSMVRFPWIVNNKLTHVAASYYKDHPDFDKIVKLDTLDSDQRIYDSLTSIQQVVNFCKKTGAHLIMATIHTNLEIISEAAKHKELLIIHGSNGLDHHSSYLDFGTDNLHPGPKTHKMYAEKILEKINDFNIFKND